MELLEAGAVVSSGTTSTDSVTQVGYWREPQEGKVVSPYNPDIVVISATICMPSRSHRICRILPCDTAHSPTKCRWTLDTLGHCADEAELCPFSVKAGLSDQVGVEQV